MRPVLKSLALANALVAGLLAATAWPQNSSAGLERVLDQMDSAARNFHTAQASFVTDQFYRAINEVDDTARQNGKIYFRRQEGATQMAAEFLGPDSKYVLYTGGKVQVYRQKIDEVDQYDAGKNRADVEGYLVLGFGGSGHELLKSYDVKYLGSEEANGIHAEKLELIPKSERFRNIFARILLWIDPARGISVQQQFFEPGGDYRLAKYSDVQINQKVSDNVFKLKTTSKTKFVSPQGG
jgi:outer membrane lipoprotein-sorting protein